MVMQRSSPLAARRLAAQAASRRRRTRAVPTARVQWCSSWQTATACPRALSPAAAMRSGSCRPLPPYTLRQRMKLANPVMLTRHISSMQERTTTLMV